MDTVIRRQSEHLENVDSQGINTEEYFDYRKWEWTFLRTQCDNLGLESFYKRYIARMQESTMSLFLVINTIMGIGHTAVLLATQERSAILIPEYFSYMFSVFLVTLSQLVLCKSAIIQNYRWVPYLMSCFTVSVLVVVDLLIPVYHSSIFYIRPTLRPAYASYVLIVIYIFLPLSKMLHSIILGVASSICYLIVFAMVTYRKDEERLFKVSSECVFLICFNLIGIYYRLMTEITIRKTFLDRRECVQSNLTLKNAREQEKGLLHSILPEHTAIQLEADIKKVIKQMKINEKDKKKREAQNKLNPKKSKIERPLSPDGTGTAIKYYEQHHDVTVLYADIVNYTKMTARLEVEYLVEILHELFVKFDLAADAHNVLRIKFLGDCYYCVSGMPVKTPNHAKNCVELGLRMIRDIRDVRKARKLDIDMRIGIHSGSIIGGVIGACKWQYDIWSTDVDIASRMESTGIPGKVHVSGQTLELLNVGEYIYDDGTEKAKRDKILNENKIKTYLITPTFADETTYFGADSMDSPGNRRMSQGIKNLMKRQERQIRKSKTSEVGTSRRNFMQNSMVQYREVMRQTCEEMEKELNRMPVGRLRFYNLFKSRLSIRKSKAMTEDDIEKQNLTNISPFFLCFQNQLSLEIPYLQERDLFLKYSLLVALLILVSIVAIQALNYAAHWNFWFTAVFTGTILILILPIVWFQKIWVMCQPATEEEDDIQMASTPEKTILRHLYHTSVVFAQHTGLRWSTFLLVIGMLTWISLICLGNCENLHDPIEGLWYDEQSHSVCSNPWAITNSIVLTIFMSFTFMKIHFILKFCIGFCVTGFYGWIVFEAKPYIFERSNSINPEFNTKLAHFLTVATVMAILHLYDRQMEYISRVDYNWKQQLYKKQSDAEFTNVSNMILLQNILPVHVADIYINRTQKDAFYTEKYENPVAIMFAAITNLNLDSDTMGLSVLNKLICDFDAILLNLSNSCRIEKIKVAGWTYMAACGLDPGRSNSSGSFQVPRSFSLNGRRSFIDNMVAQNNTASTSDETKAVKLKKSTRFSSNVVCVMTEFALQLMKSIHDNNPRLFREYDPVLLRIGISHGVDVMAGVIGSSKPLYDVWGNTVNMASRMESTGCPGRIQVNEETANVLESFDVVCERRGATEVKGRGIVQTYYVKYDSEFHLIRNDENEEERFCTRL